MFSLQLWQKSIHPLLKRKTFARISDAEAHVPATASELSTWTSLFDNRLAFCSIKRLMSLNNISSVSGGEEGLGRFPFSSIGTDGEEAVISSSSSPGISSIELTRSCVTTESMVVFVLDGVSSSIVISAMVSRSVVLFRSDGVDWLSPSISTRQRDPRQGSDNQNRSLVTGRIRWLEGVGWSRRFFNIRCIGRVWSFGHGVGLHLLVR